jgi:hypothetical protein
MNRGSTRTDPDDVATDAESLLTAGSHALTVLGDLHDSRRWFDAAFLVADQSGDVDGLAQAAVGFGGVWVHEHREATGAGVLQARLHRALALVDPASAAGLRVRARLAGEADYRRGDCAGICAVLDEARQFGDAAVLAEVLSIAHHCLLGPGHGPVRRQLAGDLVEQSALTRRPVDRLLGLLWQSVDMFLDGDRHAQRRLNELRGALAEAGHLAIGYVLDAMEVMLAIRAGRLDEAETMAQLCAKRGNSAGDAEADAWHAAQLVAIRWYQGRVGDLVPMLADLVHAPSLSAVDNSLYAALAVAAACAGDRRTATAALATLCSGGGLAALPRSSTWLVTMNGVVEAAHLLDDIDTSAEAYALLAGYEDLPMMASLAVTCFGSVRHALGVAALTMGDLGTAADHLRQAIQHNLALAHWPAVVASRRRYAEVLHRRAAPADDTHARAQLALAATEAAAGQAGPPLPAATSSPERSDNRTATCVRSGQRWRIGWAGRTVVIEESVGVLYLAALVDNPGTEIRSVDLAGGLDPVNSAQSAATSAQPLLDRTAIQQYRERLAELSHEIDEYQARGDGERAARARVERDWIVNELSAATGIGGVARNFPDNAERARTAVGKAIRRAIARVVAADTRIGDHLQQHVRTGVLCSYRPG